MTNIMYNLVHRLLSGEYRDESEAWYRVVSPGGVELLGGPDSQGERKMEMFLTGKVCNPPPPKGVKKERTPPPGER